MQVDYRIIANRRRTNVKHQREKLKRSKQKNKQKSKSKSSKSKSKSKSKEKEKSKSKSKTKSKEKTKGEESSTEQDSSSSDEQDDDIKTNDNSNKNSDDSEDGKYHKSTNRYKGHVCVVTGAGHDNLGRAVALRFAQEGASVIILDSQQFNASIDAIKAKCKEDGIEATLEGYRVNVTDEKAVKEVIDKIIEDYKFIDVLVNCVSTHGKDRGKVSHKTSVDDICQVMNVNFNGTFIMCKTVLPYMINDEYGRIVNVTSLWGKTGRAGHVAFSSSKGAIIAATKTMAREYAACGIKVNCVAPAFLDDHAELKTYHLTEKEIEKETLMHRIGELEEVAGVIAFVASEENTYTTGFCYDITGSVA